MVNVKIQGHPRSGTHYIAALVNLNFIRTSSYLPIYSGHHPFGAHTGPEGLLKEFPSTKFLYIKRDSDPVLRSIYRLRRRFGLAVDEYSEFLSHPYSKMWRSRQDVEVIRDTISERRVFTDVSITFRNVDMTPLDAHQYHVSLWREVSLQTDRVLVVDYHTLVSHFERSMLEVARFLGSKVERFADTGQPVGWMLPPGRDVRVRGDT